MLKICSAICKPYIERTKNQHHQPEEQQEEQNCLDTDEEFLGESIQYACGGRAGRSHLLHALSSPHKSQESKGSFW